MADTPVDLAHLARYTGGDKSLNAEILRLFDGQISEMVEQLQSVIAQRDQKKWRQVTHTIKGAARGVGAFAFGEAAAAAEPIDLEHLGRYTGGEKAMNAEILRLFDGQIAEMVGQLRSVIAARDAKRWKEITHTIKGAARGVGADALGDACADAEQAADMSALERAVRVDRVRNALDAALADIAAYTHEQALKSLKSPSR